jgi:DHA3 family macrolide efflux protein-like MFS transporter
MKSSKLLSRDFCLLWQGQLISQMGSQVFGVTALLWLKQTTESATLVGLTMMMLTLPGVLLGPIGGVLADRYSRRKILAASDALRGIAVVALAFAMFAFTDRPGIAVTSLMIVACVIGSVAAVFQPAGASLVPELVPPDRLSSANALIQGSFQITGFLAQAVAGILFRILGAPLVAAIDGASYLYSAVSDLLLAPRPPRTSGRGPSASRVGSLLQEIREALMFVRGRPGLRLLVGVVPFLRFFVVPFTVLFPFYVDGHLKARPDWYGFLLAGLGAGVVVGYIAAGAVKMGVATAARLMTASLVLMSIALGSLGLTSSAPTALMIVMVVGMLNGFVTVKLTTMLQLAVPDELRGRVFGVVRTLSEALAPIGMGASGLIADLSGRNVPRMYLGCGIAMAVLSSVLMLSADFRSFLVEPGAASAAKPRPAEDAA